VLPTSPPSVAASAVAVLILEAIVGNTTLRVSFVSPTSGAFHKLENSYIEAYKPRLSVSIIPTRVVFVLSLDII